jgi:long-chain acyl-CoA synthetase
MLRAFTPDGFLQQVKDFRPHSVFLVPTHAQLMRAQGEDYLRDADTTGLETLYFNAAPMPQELKLWVMDSLPHVGLHELYGSTEAGIISNLRPPDQRRKERCVGPPWFMTEIRVVDPETGEPTPPGEKGLLYSRSPYLMNGYLDDPEATAECTTEDGFLTCGDIVVRDEDGYVYVVDRVKDLVISGGSNVYPREVEEVLFTHPGVADVAVIGTPDETWGEAVTAIVVPRGEVDFLALEEHCRAALAGFKVPKRWEKADTLPRNAAGKVLKRELRDQLAT